MQPADTGRPVHHLVGFRSVHLESGTNGRMVVDCSIRPLQRWASDGFTLSPGVITVRAASFAGDPMALDATLAVPAVTPGV
jgi:hypothetical protein